MKPETARSRGCWWRVLLLHLGSKQRYDRDISPCAPYYSSHNRACVWLAETRKNISVKCIIPEDAQLCGRGWPSDRRRCRASRPLLRWRGLASWAGAQGPHERSGSGMQVFLRTSGWLVFGHLSFGFHSLLLRCGRCTSVLGLRDTKEDHLNTYHSSHLSAGVTC